MRIERDSPFVSCHTDTTDTLPVTADFLFSSPPPPEELLRTVGTCVRLPYLGRRPSSVRHTAGYRISPMWCRLFFARLLRLPGTGVEREDQAWLLRCE